MTDPTDTSDERVPEPEPPHPLPRESSGQPDDQDMDSADRANGEPDATGGGPEPTG